jgi:integrase/recombinase XerD
MNPCFLGPTLQRFFTDRLMSQLGASTHTIAAYRDTFRLVLRFAQTRVGKQPSQLHVADLDVTFFSQFLDHLELDRRNCARTRNHRLAAIHAFFRYLAVTEPALGLQCQRILAMPTKRYERVQVEFLTEEEVAAIVAAPDTHTWFGRRDRMLLILDTETGLRSSELRSLQRKDVELGSGAHVRCVGKGRKMRSTPIDKPVTARLAEWMTEQGGRPTDPLFPSSRGDRALSSDALQRLVARHAKSAQRSCPSLLNKTVTPHTLRHAAAMTLLHRGVDLTVIALWLGHESTETTQVYLHADMRLKEKALAHAAENGLPPTTYQAPDALLAFLESL